MILVQQREFVLPHENLFVYLVAFGSTPHLCLMHRRWMRTNLRLQDVISKR